MLKNKFVLTVLFILAFMVFLVPQSNAAYDVNGVTLPDLPETLPEDIANYEVSSFDYIISDGNPTDNYYNLIMVYYLNDVNSVDFYLYGSDKPNLVYIDTHGGSYLYATYYFNPSQQTEWYNNMRISEPQTDVIYLDFGRGDWFYSSFDIYSNNNLEEIFFQKTPSTIPLYQIVGEMVKEETPKMAEKILAVMKILVVFSISCLAFLILLVVFSKVFSIFRVK